MFVTMSPKRKCDICHNLYDEFLILANSLSSEYSKKLFFGVLDYDNAPDIIERLGISRVPDVRLFPAEGDPTPDDIMDLQHLGLNAETIANWIRKRTKIQIKIIEPKNYVKITFVSILIGGVLYYLRNKLTFIYNKHFWGLGACTFCLAMISGHMWYQISSPPFYLKNKDGSPVYIYYGVGIQLGTETYIVAAMHGTIVVGMILMIEAAGGTWSKRWRQFQTVFGLFLIYISFSSLVAVSRAKANM
ncbi:dolichyl-diphosphooligosaccharide--protein glycosyltransferase subunit TUSC3-like isoform X2 [Anticarsia gemmatalis]